MREKEAIKYLKDANRTNDMLCILQKSDIGECLIKALEEIHLYHARKLSLVPSDGLNKICEELDSYREIGTIEECSEAAEKKEEIRNKAINDFYESIVEAYKQMKGIPDVEKATLNTIALGIRERLKEGGSNE